nr:GNAT family N-acetyltransferase [Serinibacter salmoneus]
MRRAEPADAALVADLAAMTFPLACPDSATLADVRRHIAEHLSVQVFTDYLRDPGEVVLLAYDDAHAALGYALVHLDGRGADAPAFEGRLAELSKCYVLPRAQGTGCAAELMRAVLRAAADAGADAVWLGVNAQNVNALRYYRRHGFEPVGERTYQVGAAEHHDHVLLRTLPRGVAE